MSFDIHFIPRPPVGVELADFLEELDERADSVDFDQRASSADRELWDRVMSAITGLFTATNIVEESTCREVTDDNGTQIFMSPGEIAISTAYWFKGEEAEEKTLEIQRLAAAIEGATGLVAYDPQSDALFLGSEGSPVTELDRGSKLVQSFVNS